jgi:hypothetical protein
MKKYQIILFLIIFISSCAQYSNLSKNIIKEGDFVLKGGVFGNRTWKESLTFTRYSWFHELTLYFDLMYVRMSADSSFNNWFSKDEYKSVEICDDFILALLYSFDSNKISKVSFREQMDKQGYKQIIFKNFNQNARLHPDYLENSLKRYSIQGYCLEKTDKIVPKITFPGHKTIKLK